MFKSLMQTVDRMLGRGVIDDNMYEELEEALLAADTSITTTQAILEELRKAVREEKITTSDGIKARLQESIRTRFSQPGESLLFRNFPPCVYLFVGVNGVGKTTSIGKLATRLVKEGRKVILATGDTFRAAAIEQLEIWGERSDAEVVKGQPGSDPAAVIFDAIQAAKSRGADYVLADTAGRQHTKGNLMAELAKIARVVEKGIGRPADETLLVLDANTGQNAIRQAEEFSAATGVTGLVLTKLDGTARGGALIGIYDQFKIPIKLIGVGEKAEDLRNFDAEVFAANLFE
jgi:fused signal recognition particle receptor